MDTAKTEAAISAIILQGYIELVPQLVGTKFTVTHDLGKVAGSIYVCSDWAERETGRPGLMIVIEKSAIGDRCIRTNPYGSSKSVESSMYSLLRKRMPPKKMFSKYRGTWFLTSAKL